MYAPERGPGLFSPRYNTSSTRTSTVVEDTITTLHFTLMPSIFICYSVQDLMNQTYPSQMFAPPPLISTFCCITLNPPDLFFISWFFFCVFFGFFGGGSTSIDLYWIIKEMWPLITAWRIRTGKYGGEAYRKQIFNLQSLLIYSILMNSWRGLYS